MLLNYQTFYRKYGVRLPDHLQHPPMHELKSLELPMGSIYHYVTYDGVELGPPSNDYLFRNMKKPILVGHTLELGDTKGAPRSQAMNMQSLVRDYHNLNRRTRLLRALESADRDYTSLVVQNYCLLGRAYRYIHSFYTEYYKWNNVFASMMDRIAADSQMSERQHFFYASSPKVIPSLQQLNLAVEHGMTQQALKVFRDKESWLLLELWKWVGNDRASSLLSRIPENKLHLVNIVFQESGQWSVMNLGQFNAYRKIGPEGSEAVMKAKTQMDPLQLQKRLLRFVMSVMEARTMAATSKSDDDEQVGADETAVEEDDVTILDNGDDSDDTTAVATVTEPDLSQPAETVTDLVSSDQQVDTAESEYDALSDDEVAQRLKTEDDILDEELAQLNEIARRQEADAQSQEVSLHEATFAATATDLSSGVLAVCDRLADEGLLSAAEYKRFNKLANTYKTLRAPNGKTLEEFINIPPEELKIHESDRMHDSKTVFDKTMLKSSLLSFDDRYISQVMERDVASMVMSLQNAGIAVTDYKVEHVDDILGGYKRYAIRLNPVVGQASTIQFRLPVVEANGTYMSNGVKYRLRKQRGD